MFLDEAPQRQPALCPEWDRRRPGERPCQCVSERRQDQTRTKGDGVSCVSKNTHAKNRFTIVVQPGDIEMFKATGSPWPPRRGVGTDPPCPGRMPSHNDLHLM